MVVIVIGWALFVTSHSGWALFVTSHCDVKFVFQI